MSPGAAMWARSVLRANVRATIMLAVFAGVAGGAVLTAAEVYRRTSTAFGRFTDRADIADVGVISCPPGVTVDDVDEVGPVASGCSSPEAAASVRDTLRSSPDVTSAARGGLGLVGIADPATPSGWSVTLANMEIDPGPGLLSATPLIVEGRVADESRVDEVAINEGLANFRGFDVGDEIVVRPFLGEQIFEAGEPDAVPRGPQSRLRVVGIVRMPDDLQPPRPTGGIPGAESRDSYLHTTPAWWARNGPDVATYFLGVAVHVDRTRVDPDSFVEDLGQLLPGRIVQPQSVVGDTTAVTEVIDIESSAVLVVTAVVAVAAVVFVGQAVARQIRRDSAARPTLTALGLTRHDFVTAAALRSAPAAAGGAVIAAAVAIVLSPVGPVGLARNAEFAPGLRVDVPVVALGGVGVMVLVVAASSIAARADRRRDSPRTRTRAGLRLPWTATLRTGALLARTRGTGAAIGCAALAVAGVAGSTALSASLDALERHPERFGATWSLFVGEYADRAGWSAGRELAAANPVVAATGGVMSSAERVGGVTLLLVAFEPTSDEEIVPVVLEGRAPRGIHEVALGRKAMDSLGVQIGDEVAPFGSYDGEVTVVGRVVANINGSENANPSMVAVVTEELLRASVQFEVDVTLQNVLVALEPGVSLVDGATALQQDFGRFVSPPAPPTDIRNLRLVAPAVIVAASVVVLFAIAAWSHALVTAVRSRRRDLATLRALGLTRTQVSAAVGWDATVVAAVAAGAGIPIGAVAARLVWESIEDRLGVVSPVEMPAVVLLGCAVGALVIANLVTVLPGRRAARTRPVDVLRAE